MVSPYPPPQKKKGDTTPIFRLKIGLMSPHIQVQAGILPDIIGPEFVLNLSPFFRFAFRIKKGEKNIQLVLSKETEVVGSSTHRLKCCLPVHVHTNTDIAGCNIALAFVIKHGASTIDAYCFLFSIF